MASIHSGFSLFPVCWTNITMFLGEVKGFNKSEVLIHISTDIGIVNGEMSKDTLIINQESSSKRETSFFHKNTIVSGNIMGEITEKVESKFSSESTNFSWRLDPSSMREMRINRNTENISV
eukprot:NODE_4108_length_696_cov_106.027821_g3481_i0.p2 GENE.NODE_4108_length_696_cov_106.027821_g3481_i0~~NODE_4108_length_696_cov_106.027821_g3481_i0.p2  ORF type:complete len:121 (+),score=10.64 NODE_4108_length_696_cov_106.027821_g3481_i0:119-481(+)